MPAAVLFVDDEEKVLNSANRIFIDNHIRILNAANAEEALSHFRNEEIAVIVSDNQMPGMSGLELLSRVREISPDTIKILMTGHDDLVTAVDAINRDEVFRFVIKPWDGEILMQIVQEGMNRYMIVQGMREKNESNLLSLAQTIELKDHYTQGHCESVARYALMIGTTLNLDEETLKLLRYGSWLHDCGKIGVPEKILNKRGQLSENEYETIKHHPRWGADVALQAELPSEIVNIILRHHERFDGSGYPSGLEGTDIPHEARIVTIADVYDALTTDRPYREGFDTAKALGIMQKMKGIIFDPDLLDIFLYECLRVQDNLKHPSIQA